MTRETVDELYREYGPIVYARCRRILADDALAQDATQEVFLRALGGFGRSPDKHHAIRWIFRVATNHCLNVLRSRQRFDRTIAQAPEAVPASAEQRLSDRNLVLQLLRRVPSKHAATAWLYHVDGLEQSEVATTLGVSKRTVANHLKAFAESAAMLADGDG